MPWSAPRPCRKCRQRTTRDRSGYCDVCRPLAASETNRAYNRFRRDRHPLHGSRRWRDVSREVLREHPLCQSCASVGIETLATEVHHKVPVAQGGPWFGRANLMAVCHACHMTIEVAAARQARVGGGVSQKYDTPRLASDAQPSLTHTAGGEKG